MHRLRPLVDALGEEGGRFTAAKTLAEAIGAHCLLLWVRDPELGVMLPAPGMPQTVCAGETWRAFLRRCEAGGEVSARDIEILGDRWTACAHACGQCAFVLLGKERVPAFPVELVEALPLLAQVLQAQQALRLGIAETEHARQAADRAHQLAAALDRARASAAELNRQLRSEHQHKDEFLAMLAHELRNPLAPISTGIDVLGRLSPTDAVTRDRQLAIMRRQMQQLTHIIDDLLDVSRVSRGHIALRRQVLAMDEVLATAIDATRPLLLSRRHTLEMQRHCARGLHVLGDRVRLVQVFSNLLNNAAKYTDPGGRIVVEATQEASSVHISVRDDGAGIPAAMLRTVFDMFWQVPGSLARSPGGLGIGLTLVRKLVELHGGRVEARSEGLGHGSEFVVSLPLAQPVVPEASPSAPAPSLAVVPGQARVLLVDDNADAAESMAELLRGLGAHVTVARDGADALAVTAATGLPDLALLDIGLPGMDGYALAREWRRRFGEGARLVALTGYGSDDDRHRARSSGFDLHLVKPVSVDVIDALVRNLAREKAVPM